MKQIIALIILVFVFFGCTQRQTVQLKMPNKQNTFAKPAKTMPVKEDKITVVQELEPIDIIESDNKGKIKKEEPVEYEVAPIIEGDKIENQKISAPKGSSENEIENKIEIDTTKVKMKVAFLYPSNLVSKYAKSSINTVSGYLSHQDSDYELVVIDTENESASRIDSAFQEVKKSNIKNVIALFTPNAVGTLNNVVSNDLKVYLPLIEKKEVSSSNSSLIFGSISYEEQVKKLVNYSSGNNVMFYQDTYLGLKLKKSYESIVSDTRLKKEISKHENNFKGIVTGSGLANSTLFLNTDIVKSSLILSQLRSYDIYPKVILSTQLSYDPLLMTLTQDKDRDKLIVANSIDVVDKELRDDIAISGGNIVYEWVDYSTLVGINYLYYGKNSNLVPTKIENNQAMYNPKLFRSTEFGFSEIK
ncbi:MAG: hypothetical protein RBT22_06385 [Aliarcobacter sp.]|nr:hypothetical protein [Aliarcobacter sp.]